jgi:energy-coupling factor transporter ATP-binding protein EcfA2
MMSLNIESKKIKNPFPGLRPFETDEYRLFFGREGQASALISRLERSHFLAIVGTSGSGKSSLVRAGLLPALRGGLMAGAGSGWRIAIMRPGSDPIGNLAAALADKGVLSEAAGGLAPAEALAVIEATLRRGSLGLVDAARQARLGEHDKLLVVVDQFEELFRFRAARPASSSGDDASAFVKLLLEAAQQRELQIYIVPTMRSDFLGDCAQFQGLPEAINDGQYLIPRMTRDERRFAITGPVGVTRGKISEPLVNRLMNDVGDNPDQLPILQHALMRTWDYWAAHRRNGEPIGIEHYEAVGTMSDALSHHADEAFNELPAARSRLIAEKLFKALTERGADNREIRRPTCLKDICAISEATATEVIVVVDVFRGGGRSFLMPPAGVALEPDTVIDISHESLIRNWLRLKDWVNEEAQSARIYRRLAEAAVLHREGSEGLLQDPGLQIALDWQQKTKPTAAWATRYHPEFEHSIAYLEDSRGARDAAVAERERQGEEQLKRERRELEQAQLYAEQQRRAARRLRYLSLGMAIMFLLALATAGYAMVQRKQSLLNEQKAVREKEVTSSALKQMQISEEGRKIAEASEAKAQLDKDKALADALAEKDRADKQKGIAEQRAKQAQVAEMQAKVAETEAKRRALALEANGLFRDATILAERGDFGRATEKFEATIKGLQGNRINDPEGVADTHVQLGQVSFSSMQSTRMELIPDWTRANQAVDHYDQAAEFYAEKAGAPDKAAAALLSVGETLLKIANDEPVGRRVNRDDEELAALSIKPPLISLGAGFQAFSEDEDPKVQLKNKALERYKRAFQFYHESGNVEGAQKAAFKIGRSYLRDELDKEKDTTRNLDGNIVPEGARQRAFNPRSNEWRAISYFKEVERLALSQGKKDADIYRLLVLVGALSFEVKDFKVDEDKESSRAESEAYFKRARQAYMTVVRDPAREGDAWRDAAEISEQALLYEAAFSLYSRASNVYLSAQNYSGVARMYYERGDVMLKRNDKNTPYLTEAVRGHYQNAISAYKMNLEKGNVLDGYAWEEEFFAIGSFAEEIRDNQLALETYDVALRLAQARNNLPMQARALSETGQLQTQFAPKEARQSYMRAFALYSQMRDQAVERDDTAAGDEAAASLERITSIVHSLDSDISRQAVRPLTADAFCPFPVAIYAQQSADGSVVKFVTTATYAGPSELKFKWTLGPNSGRIVSGADERTLEVDTSGLGDARVTATVVVDDGSGVAACRQTVRASTTITPAKN